eukprot:Platyproteum_vivax@DN3574_c0_g1_i1.p1
MATHRIEYQQRVRKAIAAYDEHKENIKQFLSEFADETGQSKYKALLQQVANREVKSFDLDMEDLERGLDDETMDALLHNTSRYLQFIYEAADSLLPAPTPEALQTLEGTNISRAKRLRILYEENDQLPKSCKRYYEIRLVPSASVVSVPLRGVRAEHIGKYVQMEAVVTRVSAVKPRMLVATYTCLRCESRVFQQVEGTTFQPVTLCPGESCRQQKTQGDIQMELDLCKFEKYQEVKIQEIASQVPEGNVPRSLTCLVRGTLTRQLLPGDSLEIAGIFLPYAKRGFSRFRSGLSAETYLEVHHIRKHRRGFVVSNEYSPQQIENILKNTPNMYDKLAMSIAPEIFGHLDVKKALLLQLVGGVTKNMQDGMKIRGDLHVLLMGDPGVAKSQLLKHIGTLAPRSVYTTGKGSSGVGLTASVMKDPNTGEITLEGGALVLADNGVCAIDEFDKMEEGDRTAIHEVMEQQTVSIAKAGITTTLNARTTVLAAANPAYGRYDVTKSVLANINLPAALLSRFDVQFLLLDKTSKQTDMQLARHVLHVHQTGLPPKNKDQETFEPKFIRAYVAHAKSVDPHIPSDVQNKFVEAYVEMRQDEAEEWSGTKSYTTPRTLLGVLRMSQALARVQLKKEVEESDLDEALRLAKASKASVENPFDDEEDADDQSAEDRLWELIRKERDRVTTVQRRRAKAMANNGEDVEMQEPWIDMHTIDTQAMAKGFSHAQVMQVIEEYEALNVVFLNESGTKIMFTEA